MRAGGAAPPVSAPLPDTPPGTPTGAAAAAFSNCFSDFADTPRPGQAAAETSRVTRRIMDEQAVDRLRTRAESLLRELWEMLPRFLIALGHTQAELDTLSSQLRSRLEPMLLDGVATHIERMWTILGVFRALAAADAAPASRLLRGALSASSLDATLARMVANGSITALRSVLEKTYAIPPLAQAAFAVTICHFTPKEALCVAQLAAAAKRVSFVDARGRLMIGDDTTLLAVRLGEVDRAGAEFDVASVARPLVRALLRVESAVLKMGGGIDWTRMVQNTADSLLAHGTGAVPRVFLDDLLADLTAHAIAQSRREAARAALDLGDSGEQGWRPGAGHDRAAARYPVLDR